MKPENHDLSSFTRQSDNLDQFAEEFIGALAQHRNWMRKQKDLVPA
jgi:hypothetical protein